jgi:hypothetical protein
MFPEENQESLIYFDESVPIKLEESRISPKTISNSPAGEAIVNVPTNQPPKLTPSTLSLSSIALTASQEESSKGLPTVPRLDDVKLTSIGGTTEPQSPPLSQQLAIPVRIPPTRALTNSRTEVFTTIPDFGQRTQRRVS